MTSMSAVAPNPDWKPNVVLILADNHDRGELGCYGGGDLRGAPTPVYEDITTDGAAERIREQAMARFGTW